MRRPVCGEGIVQDALLCAAPLRKHPINAGNSKAIYAYFSKLQYTRQDGSLSLVFREDISISLVLFNCRDCIFDSAPLRPITSYRRHTQLRTNAWKNHPRE